MTKAEHKKLINLWQGIVKDKAGRRCEICGKCKYLNAHHVISKSERNLAYYIPNGVALCSGHHTLCTLSAHKNPLWFRKLMIVKRGNGWERDLIIRSRPQVLGLKKDFNYWNNYLINEAKKVNK